MTSSHCFSLKKRKEVNHEVTLDKNRCPTLGGERDTNEIAIPLRIRDTAGFKAQNYE